jgi:hypothetical protein
MSLASSQTAQAQYFSRPADERFPTLQALIDHAEHDRQLSVERTYNLKDLSATSDGRSVMLASPKGPAHLTHWAFGQLCRTVGAPASYLREGLTPDLAASCLSHGLSASPVGSTAMILARRPNGTPYPTLRAITSERYGRVWDSVLYGAIQEQVAKGSQYGMGGFSLPPTWDGCPAGAYRGDRDSFVVLVDGGSIVPDPTMQGRSTGHGGQDSGNMYRGLLIRNSEVGAASLIIEQILLRGICGNHLLIGAAIDRSFKRRHIGVDTLRDTIREIGQIAYRWTQRSVQDDVSLVRRLIDHQLAETKAGVVDELRAMGATEEQATRAYDVCERTEVVAPTSYWGVAQGLTRLSQGDDGAVYQDSRFELDRLAGLVMARGARLVAA